MLHLGRLKVLSEVVSKGSFSAAAESLSYTQSAVSQAIARLESETGATLVVRDRRGVRPTAAGATLVEHAEAIFAQWQPPRPTVAAYSASAGGGRRGAPFRPPGRRRCPRPWPASGTGHPTVRR